MMTIYDITLEDIWRFWTFVTRLSPNDCWLWKSQPGRNYGNFSIGKRNISAHRFSYLIHYRELSDDLLILHSCDNGFCVNPAHLSAGTQLQNRQDCVRKGRQAVGEDHGKSILTPTEVSFIRRRKDEHPGITNKQLATEFNVSASCISNILAGNSWKWLK